MLENILKLLLTKTAMTSEQIAAGLGVESVSQQLELLEQQELVRRGGLGYSVTQAGLSCVPVQYTDELVKYNLLGVAGNRSVGTTQRKSRIHG